MGIYFIEILSQKSPKLIYFKIDKLYVAQSVLKSFIKNCISLEVLEITKYLGYEEIECGSLNGILDDTELFNYNLKTLILPNFQFNFDALGVIAVIFHFTITL